MVGEHVVGLGLRACDLHRLDELPLGATPPARADLRALDEQHVHEDQDQEKPDHEHDRAPRGLPPGFLAFAREVVQQLVVGDEKAVEQRVAARLHQRIPGCPR